MAVPPSPAELIAEFVLRRRGEAPFALGICGAQGSGKTTAVAEVCARLATERLKVAAFSLDDLYLTRAERQILAREVHPLFATRGPPGTHDLALGLDVLDRLKAGDTLDLPVFDKSVDDRSPRDSWRRFDGPADVILLEGWCVGARPQAEALLARPVNELERSEDTDGRWRRWANYALAGYRPLWERLDALVMLQAPSFEVVAGWRDQQEAGLRRVGGTGVMDAAAVRRFVQHYERITRHMMAEMPGRADLVIRLGRGREVIGLPRSV